MVNIHPTAVIDSKAELGIGVSIGPYCCVGANVRLGDNVNLKSHAVIEASRVSVPIVRYFHLQW